MLILSSSETFLDLLTPLWKLFKDYSNDNAAPVVALSELVNWLFSRVSVGENAKTSSKNWKFFMLFVIIVVCVVYL